MKVTLKRNFRYTVLFGAAALFLMTGLFSTAADMPQAGQTAPDFTLLSQDGTPVTLSEYRGKWVVLYFYPKDNTPGCTLEAHNFQRDLSSYQSEHAVIIGVSVDSTDSHKNFCAKQGLTFKLAADSDKKITQRYGSLNNILGFRIAARNTFLIDPEGKIVKVWTGVDPNHHSAEVLSELKQREKKG